MICDSQKKSIFSDLVLGSVKSNPFSRNLHEMKVECTTYGREEEAIHFNRATYEHYISSKLLTCDIFDYYILESISFLKPDSALCKQLTEAPHLNYWVHLKEFSYTLCLKCRQVTIRNYTIRVCKM